MTTASYRGRPTVPPRRVRRLRLAGPLHQKQQGEFEALTAGYADHAYRDAEEALLAEGADAAATLHARSEDPRPVARLLARVLLALLSGGLAAYRAAVTDLIELGKSVKDTPAGQPSPTGVRYFLLERYGNEVAAPSAVRAMKELHWPEWRVRGIVLYAEASLAPAAAPALLHLAIDTGDEATRAVAREAFAKFSEDDRFAALRAARTGLRATGKTPPPAVAALLAGLAE